MTDFDKLHNPRTVPSFRNSENKKEREEAKKKAKKKRKKDGCRNGNVNGWNDMCNVTLSKTVDFCLYS